jgi:hypothetical protein
VKRIFRGESDGKRITMMERVPVILRSCPLPTIRRWSARMWKLVHVYANPTVDGPLARFIMKKYRGHRCVPEFVGAELDTMRAEMEKDLAD